jgi:hypothetical protein
MKKVVIFISFLLLIRGPLVHAQADTSIYLLTCGPGTETYSIYGHSAVRIVIPEKKIDLVFNWGGFDFNAPNFAWKFAKGRLDYFLFEESLGSFLSYYQSEKRYVHSQKMNLESNEKEIIVSLIKENLRPENVKYRYDFFYDDCCTRIRDIFEKALGNKLLYPPAETGKMLTFRKMVARFQNPYPWLQFGIDLIMGSTSDKAASFRDRMFLPLEMQTELSEAVVNRNGKMIPLLQNPEIILNFEPPAVQNKFLTSPVSLFTILLVIITILSGWLKKMKIIKMLDIVIFSTFSILSILMVFFNFFTDHQQMTWNLNIIWLNPFLILCLISLLLRTPKLLWFRVVFYLSVAFLILQLILPQEFNSANLPLIIIIIVRCLYRSKFRWNTIYKSPV